MRNTAMNPVQRGKLAIAAAAIGVGLLSVTGCGFVNAQQTTHQYSASDGIKADLGSLQLRNILIVASGEKEPGRVIGAVFNTSSHRRHPHRERRQRRPDRNPGQGQR